MLLVLNTVLFSHSKLILVAKEKKSFCYMLNLCQRIILFLNYNNIYLSYFFIKISFQLFVTAVSYLNKVVKQVTIFTPSNKAS